MRLPLTVPPRGTARFDVVGLGQNSVDLVAVLHGYPEKNTKQQLQSCVQLPGGQIATALSVCGRLGWRVSYIGTFGDDAPGRLSRESLVAEGVDLGASQTVAASANQFAVVLVDASSGARTVLWNRPPALAMDPSSLPMSAVTAGRFLLVDGSDIPASTEAAKGARHARIPTVIDVETVGAGIHELLENIDAIIAAEFFPEELTGCAEPGHALEAMAREFAAPLVCVTLGAAGSLAQCGGREIRTPAFPVECVDTTGAGDAFRGGFLAACLANPGGDVEDILIYANAVAALNCRALGARSAMPSVHDVEQLLLARRVG